MGSELSASALLTGCEVFRGRGAAAKNAAAVREIYESIRTSYGPLGLDKMCIDASGAVSITNDGATILGGMLLEDPTAKLLVNLALEQDRTVGDGTTSVVLVACNLIMAGSQLIADGVHPSVVVSGYRMAFNESVRYVKENVAKRIESGSLDTIADAVVGTCMASKIISGAQAHFAAIARSALSNVSEGGKYPVERVNILKAPGGSLNDSEFFDGYVLNCTVASRLMLKRLCSPKIACLGFSLLREKLPLTAAITVSDPTALEAIRSQEAELTRTKARALIAAGTTLVLTTGGIDEQIIKMFVENGIVAVRRCAREDLVAIARATGTDLKDALLDSNGACLVENLGTCESFEIRETGDYDLVYLSGCASRLSTILLRGPNSQILDETQRALNDALQVLRRTLEARSVVPGGGAVEAALSFMLEDFASRINVREHIAIHRFAEALLTLPRILATNAGLDADSLVGELLRKQHALFAAGTYNRFLGLDVIAGTVQDNMEHGIVEPTVYKLKALKAATEAAIGVLRINEISIFPK